MQGSFDDTKGSLAVQQCATEHSRAELEEAAQRTAHYLALGAAGALLAYLQQVFIFAMITHALVTHADLATTWAQHAWHSHQTGRHAWTALVDGPIWELLLS